MSPRTGKRPLTRFVLPSALLAFVVAAAASGSVLVAQEAPRRINFERDSSTAEVSARLSGRSDRHEYIFFSRTGRTLYPRGGVVLASTSSSRARGGRLIYK